MNGRTQSTPYRNSKPLMRRQFGFVVTCVTTKAALSNNQCDKAYVNHATYQLINVFMIYGVQIATFKVSRKSLQLRP